MEFWFEFAIVSDVIQATMVVHAASFVTFLGFIDVVDTSNARLKVKSDAKKDGQAPIVMKVGYDVINLISIV